MHPSSAILISVIFFVLGCIAITLVFHKVTEENIAAGVLIYKNKAYRIIPMEK